MAPIEPSKQPPRPILRTNSQTPQQSQSSSAAQSPLTERRLQQRSQLSGSYYGTMSSSASRPETSQPEPASPANPQRPNKKPGLGRRLSSQGPKKGQEFSVDDGEDEIEAETMRQRTTRTSSSGTVLRRQPSTIRRKPTAQPPKLATVDSNEDDDNESPRESRKATVVQPPPTEGSNNGQEEEDTPEPEEEVEEDSPIDDDDDDDNVSEAESFTLRDRQDAINETHPFGIRIWKPALYKKDRSVQKGAEGDIHSTPGLYVSSWLLLFNLAWTLLFGWWLAVLAAFGSLLCLIFGFHSSSFEYGQVLWGLATYIFYPFGKYVKLIQDEAYAEEDEGEGRSISEYERWQSGDIEEGRLFFGPLNGMSSLVGRRRDSIDSSATETQSLLGRTGRGTVQNDANGRAKRRLFGRGQWNVGRIVFFVVFYGVLTPCLLLVSGICWLFVFTIPMGRVTIMLFEHLRRHPLALSFHSESADTRRPGEPPSSILLCTYRAVGSRYWKYTIDGTNIFLINLLGIVAFVIFDYWVLDQALGIKNALTSEGLVFTLALFSIIPLAYFIGQAVASISAQSSMGIGATINAFFSTIVEVFLYCVALKEGKAALVEGSIIGSIFAAILLLPGLSMCFGAIKRKTQRFNVKSAGVTSTMLLFAVIASFAPTLFYQIYGSHELNCHQCHHSPIAAESERDCRRCYFSQTPALHDRFYLEALRPYIWFSAVMLFLSYIVGLLFTLRTHAAVIWNDQLDEKKDAHQHMADSQLSTSAQYEHPHLSRHSTAEFSSGLARTDIRQSHLYKRILGQTSQNVGLHPHIEIPHEGHRPASRASSNTPHLVPPKDDGEISQEHALHVAGLTDEQTQMISQHVAEVAATAAAVAARDATKAPRKVTQIAATTTRPPNESHHSHKVTPMHASTDAAHTDVAAGHASGGHDAPNWSRSKSAAILLTATVAYAIIAEILVNTVDSVLGNSGIDEKFLGITLFALVPNTTEFLNAISFAMNGNIALSMEIGSAYALQVCLLQVPALVLFSAIYGQWIPDMEVARHTFTLIFPQWDMVTVILCVFLLSYVYSEGKSNYFKGSILILAYLVITVGFYFSSFDHMDLNGVSPYDKLALGGFMQKNYQMESSSFKVHGRRNSGRAY